MGYLLKEALKCLCGLNQWSYAVFWKIGCQNPKLLIWEDCYYETTLESMHLCMSRVNNGQVEVQYENKVSGLMDRMMTKNQIIIVGEGMVGRAAFTGKHQWFLTENFLTEAHPPEVLNEARHQYSAGMQTVAVIPVLPHGVVQLGSCFNITENVGFAEDVKSLICQLGCIPDALLTESYTGDEPPQRVIPTLPGGFVSGGHSGHVNMKNSTSVSNSSNQHSSLSYASTFVGESSDSVKRQVRIFPPATASTFQTRNLPQPLARPNDNHRQSAMFPVTKPNDFERAITITPNIQELMKLNNPLGSTTGFNNQNNNGQSSASCGNLRLKDKQTLSDSNSQDPNSSNSFSSNSFVKHHRRIPGGLNSSANKSPLFGRSQSSNNMASHHKNSVQRSFSNLSRQADISLSSIDIDGFGLQNANMFTTDNVPHLLEDSLDLIEEAPMKESSENDLFEALHSQLSHPDEQMTLGELFPDYIQGIGEHKIENESLLPKKVLLEDFQLQQPSSDDLFDILGVDFKNKLINSNQYSFLDVPYIENSGMGKYASTISQQGQGLSSVTGGIGVSGLGPERCFDALISKSHLASSQSLSDTVSCMETTKSSGGAAQSTSSKFNGACMSSQLSAEVFCRPRTLGKAGMEGSSSFRSGFLEEDAQNCSQSSSIYGSQISSLIEQCNNGKRDGSVSTAYSKRPDEVGKSKRKRLKPGENPRPRPKDRQMIQDRVKELREMVPHGAKCSIDALLERTIKHMVFLQSVTKHADKLNQTGESQIISKGGLLLKDNFEGGATWAFEVGSQSMVCPIIVEDLRLPRQMLIEMLCEDRGFFLEIADFIRGLGLTILKGVIEARNEKIWARFSVEANRDVTRMEIFISLVGLLEQTANRSGGADNEIFSENMTVHRSVHQAPVYTGNQ